jgi:leucyl aminopeptidase
MRVVASPALSVKTGVELIVFGVLGGDDYVVPQTVTDALGDVSSYAERCKFNGTVNKTLVLPSLGRLDATWVLLVGLGEGGVDAVRSAAGVVGKFARDKGAESVGMDLSLGGTDANCVATSVDGFSVGNYRFDRYINEEKRKSPCTSLDVVGDGAQIQRSVALAAAVRFTRDLINEPADAIYPETLAAAAESLAGPRLSVEIWDRAKIKAEGMGGIEAVGRGSPRGPRFVHMIYRPTGTPRRKIALVGKGVTFDSGGLSLKPTNGMLTMRMDMGGAATVLGAMHAVAALEPDVEVHGIFGAVENMTAGDAYKLGDVLKMRNGKTVEVHNTDAEGRLVLADCLSYASELNVDACVDLATLTGAVVVALGGNYTGLFTHHDELAEELLGHAAETADGLWRLPLDKDYRSKLDATWADIKNVGGREGGSIVAALFLSEFVGEMTWAHLDIAGAAWADKAHGAFVPGATGAMVQTLVRWVEA